MKALYREFGAESRTELIHWFIPRSVINAMKSHPGSIPAPKPMSARQAMINYHQSRISKMVNDQQRVKASLRWKKWRSAKMPTDATPLPVYRAMPAEECDDPRNVDLRISDKTKLTQRRVAVTAVRDPRRPESQYRARV